MYLQKLVLHNFKCFENLELDFSPRLTVIAGSNGSGKTSVLEAAAIAVSALFVKMDQISGRSLNKNQAYSKNISGKMIAGKDASAQYPASVAASATIENREVVWLRSLNGPFGRTTAIGAKSIIGIGFQFQERLRKGDASLILPAIVYYGTGRQWDYRRGKQDNVPEANNRSNGYIGCMDGTVNVKRMMNWFLKVTVQKYQNQELDMGDIPELDAVYSAIESCYKQITGSNFAEIRYSIAAGDLEISYKDPSGSIVRKSVSQLNDDCKNIIGLVADIACRMAVLNPQLLGNVCKETEGIILVDDIDLYLQSEWKSRILKILMEVFPKIQYIVSTSNPEVTGTVKGKGIIVLEENRHGKSANIS